MKDKVDLSQIKIVGLHRPGQTLHRCTDGSGSVRPVCGLAELIR